MKRLLSTIMLLALFSTAFSQSKLDNLTNNPYKKDGRFIGKVSGKGNGFASFDVVFEFWGLLGEPLSMYYFKWTRPQNFGSISTNCYLSTISKDPELEKIYNRMTPMPDLKVALKIRLRKGTTDIATVYHIANIDLPDPAGKFNTFSLPGTKDWIDMFTPHDAIAKGQRVFVAGDKSNANNDKLVSLYNARDKEGYAKQIKSFFEQADNVVVTLANDKPVTNLKWPEYDFKLLREACTSKPATTKKTTPATELDDLLGSTGYSEKDRAGNGTDRADAAYCKVKDYKDKAALTEARRLYAQATANPETAAYAKEQIVRIDKLLNYKEPNIVPSLDGVWESTTGRMKFEIKGNKGVILKVTSKDWVKAVDNNVIVLNSTLKYDNIKYEGNFIWSCTQLWLDTRSNGVQNILYNRCSIEMSSDGNSFKTVGNPPNSTESIVSEYTRVE